MTHADGGGTRRTRGQQFTSRSTLLALTSLVLVVLAWMFGHSLEVGQNAEEVEPPASEGSTGRLHPPAAVDERPDPVVDRTALTPRAFGPTQYLLHGTLLSAHGLPVAGCKFGAGPADATPRYPPAPVAPVDGATGPQGEWTLAHDPTLHDGPPTITFHPHPGISVTYSLERYDPEEDHDLALPPFAELTVRMLDAPGRWWLIIQPGRRGVPYRSEGRYGPVVATRRLFRSDHSDGPGEVTFVGLAGTCSTISAQGAQADFSPRGFQEACFPGTVEFRSVEVVPGITVRIQEAGTREMSDIGGEVLYFYRDDQGDVAQFSLRTIVSGEGNLAMLPGVNPFPAEFYENPDAIEVVCVLDDGEHFASGAGVFDDFDVIPRQVMTFVRGTGVKPVRIRDEHLDDVVGIYVDVIDHGIRRIRMGDTPTGRTERIGPPWGDLFRHLDDGSGMVSLGSERWIQMWLVRADGVIGVIAYGTGELPVQWAEPTEEVEAPVRSLVAEVEWGTRRTIELFVDVEAQLPGHRSPLWVRIGSRSFHVSREHPESLIWKFPVAPRLGLAYRAVGRMYGTSGQLGPLLFR